MTRAIQATTRDALRERFWARVDRDGPTSRADLGACWIWKGRLSRQGYGRFDTLARFGKRTTLAPHRFAYEDMVGEIPSGLQLDHLCRVRHCVNPSHLEPVTARENLLRGDTLPARELRNTHCPSGHPYSPDNLYLSTGYRRCRTCHRARMQEQRSRAR